MRFRLHGFRLINKASIAASTTGCIRTMSDQRITILMLSLHGLVRGHDLELGRDADTGGQITYVVELARALGRHAAGRTTDALNR